MPRAADGNAPLPPRLEFGSEFANNVVEPKGVFRLEFLDHVPYVQFDELGVVLCASQAGSTALQAISGGETGASSELHRAARGLGDSTFGVTELLPRDGSLANYFGLIWRTKSEGAPRYVALLLHGDLFAADRLGWSRVFSRPS